MNRMELFIIRHSLVDFRSQQTRYYIFGIRVPRRWFYWLGLGGVRK